MTINRYDIEGLCSFTPTIFEDERGLFFESFNQNVFNDIVKKDVIFVQDNQSSSVKNVVRGLHFQAPPFAQGKLVRVSKGRAIDVVVDIRKDSKTYGQHLCIELSEKNKTIFWIPEGFAHGFVALEEETIFNYKCTDYYNKDSEGCILWNDPGLNIDWKVENPSLSPKDKEGLLFESFNSPF